MPLAQVSPGFRRHRSQGLLTAVIGWLGEKNHPPLATPGPLAACVLPALCGGHISLHSSPPGPLASGDSPGRCLHQAPRLRLLGASADTLLALEMNRVPANVAHLSSFLPLLPPQQPCLVAASPCTRRRGLPASHPAPCLQHLPPLVSAPVSAPSSAPTPAEKLCSPLDRIGAAQLLLLPGLLPAAWFCVWDSPLDWKPVRARAVPVAHSQSLGG